MSQKDARSLVGRTTKRSTGQTSELDEEPKDKRDKHDTGLEAQDGVLDGRQTILKAPLEGSWLGGNKYRTMRTDENDECGDCTSKVFDESSERGVSNE